MPSPARERLFRLIMIAGAAMIVGVMCIGAELAARHYERHRSMPLDSLIDLQMRAIAFQPDLVIVYQGHNDFNYSIPPPLHQKPSDLFPLEARPRSALTRWTTVHSLLYAKEEVRIADLVERLTRF